MRGLKGIIVYTLLYICGSLSLKAADSLQISLMTCSPGQEVYALYGHTALRCTNYTAGWDVVFNYGVFNFKAPHFVWRFALGECDYEVAAVPFEGFAFEYATRGSAVVQQVLNLTDAEKNTLVTSLLVNCRPENKKYRYNFLSDNCTTRVRDQIERAVTGEIEYPETSARKTYRSIMHQYTREHPWAELGNDLCLGADVDTLIPLRQEMFAPLYFSDYADKAVIRDRQGHVRPLVAERTTIVHQKPLPPESGFPLSPATCAWGLLAVVACLTGWEVKVNRILWGQDVVWLLLQGLAGCIISFLFFFSQHPSVGSNWQIWVLNPLPLFFLPSVIRGAMKKRRVWYHYGKAVSLTLFMVFFSIIPQDFSVIIVPLALTLWLRSMSYLWFYKRNSLR